MPQVTEDSSVQIRNPVANRADFDSHKFRGTFGWATDQAAPVFCPADDANYVRLSVHPDEAPDAGTLNSGDTILVSVGGVQKKTTVLAIGGGGTWQPLDSDLTAIAALATQAFGRSLLTGANAGAVRTLIDAPSTGDLAGYQPKDTDLTAIAALTTDAFGRSLLTQTSGASVRALIGAGTSSFNGAYASLTSLPAAIDALDALTPAADRLPYFTNGTTAALATFSAFSRTLLDDADAATARATLGAGTVSSVAMTVPSGFAVVGSPITGSGTLAVTLASQTADKVLASPSGAPGTPSFIALSASHIPALPWAKITTGLPTTLSGYGITDAQPLDSDLTAIAALTTQAFGRSLLTQANAAAARSTLGAGTVSSVDLSAPSIFTVSGNPVTGSGTLTLTLASQTADKVLASPSGAPGAPSMITLSASHIPNLPWAKITSGKPTTLSGYGITDGVAKSSATAIVDVVAGTWYRVASSVSGVGRNSGEFVVRWTTSGNHGVARFTAANQYNATNSLGIQQSEYSRYTGGVSKARIVYRAGVYTAEYCYLEVLFDASLIGVSITQEMRDYNGWNLDTVGTAGSVPSGYTAYEHTFVPLAGIAPGTYTKVTVNKEGRATSGALLGASDLPTDVSFSSLSLTSMSSGQIPVAGTGGVFVASGQSDDGTYLTSSRILRSYNNLTKTAGTWTAFQWAQASQERASLFSSDASGADAYPVLSLFPADTEATNRTLGVKNYCQKVSDKGGTNPGIKLALVGQSIGAGGSIGGFGGQYRIEYRPDNGATLQTAIRIGAFGGSTADAVEAAILLRANAGIESLGMRWASNAGRVGLLPSTVNPTLGVFGFSMDSVGDVDLGAPSNVRILIAGSEVVSVTDLGMDVMGTVNAGYLRAQSLSSAVVRASASGTLEEAVANTDYLPVNNPTATGVSTAFVTKHGVTDHAGSWTLNGSYTDSSKFHRQNGTGTIDLPVAATCAGREYKITFHGRFNVTFNTLGTEDLYYLNAGASYWYDIASQTWSVGDASGDNCSCDLWSDGVNWYIRW